jgi:hypothetical protein
MAITTINIGNAPNDGSGDSVRVAFNKANQNFIDLQTRIGNLAAGGGTTGLQVNGPVEITSSATPALFTGTFRLRATAQDPYFDIATTAQGFQGGPVSGITTFTNAQDSVSTTTGAVVVSGGLGVSGTTTLSEADILGNINIFRLNMSAGGEMFLPDGSPLGNITANLGAYQAWANLTLSTVANAVNQQQAIDTLTQGNLTTQANLGAYQTWANLTLSTVANAVDQQSAINTLTSNAATQSTAISDLNANLGVIHLGNLSTQANLGAYQSWANLTLSTVANAVNQQQAIEDLVSNAATQSIAIGTLDANIGTLFLGNVSTDANLGTVVGTTIPALDANLGTVVGTTIPAIDANLGTVVGTTIPALDANLGTVVGTTIPALDANLGTLFLGNVSTNANLGAYQDYANANIGTLFLGNVSTNANLGAYQDYANANIGTLFLGNVSTNANLGTVVGTTIPAIDANLGTVVGTTIPAIDANLGTVVGTTIPALDANLGTVVGTTIPALDANLGLQSINPVFTGQSLSITSGNIIAFNGNAVTYNSTKPSASTGAANDIPGMIAYDQNTGIMLLCVLPYDGTTSIWANIAAPKQCFPNCAKYTIKVENYGAI